ncbi:DNA repair protein RecN [Marinisporobacter balticus]|uniref:DNA repair protein RecN n=1 Tax=Marinisporobacter balticus TaxID=2018667 RepID=A0A4R2KYP1_9FIRM|nr:DNA repair protein RecN [Marinisporobacter balticus]TCO79204.1 DNA replication and repair protein RecN [Marinisporobacter balticus]
MLLELIIDNFALIEKLDIRFGGGLNILTGETGAGKSIIIDAVNMGIGERADKSYVRTNADRAVIQMIFRSQNEHVINLLKEKGIDLFDHDIIIITREIYNNGRSISRINDRVVTVSVVKEISKYLIDIHGQHEHQSLLYPENHIDILDACDEMKVMELLKEVATKFYERKTLKSKLENLCGSEIVQERKKDLLKFQLDEIDECALKIGEDIDLTEKYNFLSNSEHIFQTMSAAYERLYNGDGRYLSIIDSLGHIVSELEDIKTFDPTICNIYNLLQENLYTIEDVSRDVRNYRDGVEFDPLLLEQMGKRLDLINNLKRKYGNTIEEIVSYREKIALELEEIENSKTILADLKENIDKSTNEYIGLSIKLSAIRRRNAKWLEKKMTDALVGLNMRKAVFEVHFINHVDQLDEGLYTSKGLDKIEFLISANAGEKPKPLSKIASGGEMSRVMLAFKTILAKSDNIPTFIFDEIDTGISGRTANIVGEKLAIISRNHQILCITHLPQIALMADVHFYIEKNLYDDKTLTNVRNLTEKERIMELGRLLGGMTLTSLTMDHAKEMIKLGNDFKNSLK